MTNPVNQTFQAPPLLPQQTDRNSLAIKIKQATVLSIQYIARISEQARENGTNTRGLLASLNKEKYPLIGIQYPLDFRWTDPGFHMLREKGIFMNGYAPRSSWEQVGANQFRVRNGVLPSEALEKFTNGPTVGECGMAIRAAQYMAFMAVVGKDIFNRVFANNTPNHIYIGSNLPNQNNPIDRFTTFTEAAKNGISGEEGYRPVEPGDVVHFIGHNLYPQKHPSGSWMAINTICIDNTPGQQKFAGLGLPPNGISEREIKQLLLKSYNETPHASAFPHFPSKERERVPATIREKQQMVETHRDKIESIPGFFAAGVRGWNLEELQAVLDRFRETGEESTSSAPHPSS